MPIKYRICTGEFASYQVASSPVLAMRQLYMRMKFEERLPAGSTFRKLSASWTAEPAHRQPKSLLRGVA